MFGIAKASKLGGDGNVFMCFGELHEKGTNGKTQREQLGHLG